MNDVNETPEQNEETMQTLDDFVQPEIEATPEPTTPELPAKYAGKTAADLVHMLEEADSFRGRQANEVGELRKLVDNFILDQTKPQEEEAPVDWYTDPDAAIEQRLKNHPTLKAMEETTASLSLQQAQAQLRAKHPDMDNILNDSEFGAWVQGSEYRIRQLQTAHTQNDVSAADDLFSSWKERQSLNKVTEVAEDQARKSAAKTASTSTGRGAAKRGGGKKVYRRQDLIHLRVNDRQRYDAMQAEIMAAYAEGRVK